MNPNGWLVSAGPIPMATWRAACLIAGLAALPGGPGAPPPARAQLAALPDLPVLAATVVDSMVLPGPGLRGLERNGGGWWVLRGESRGLGVPRGGWTSELIRVDERGAPTVVADERDAWTGGLAFDGEAFWSAGSVPGGASLLYRISPAGRVLQTLPSPGYHPVALQYDGGYLWLLDGSSRQIYRIDPEEGKVSRKLPAPAFYPVGMARGGGYAWVADASTGRIYRLQPDNGKVDAVVDERAHARRGQVVSLAWHRDGLWVLPADARRAWRLEFAAR